MKLLIIAGARPNFMKIAPLIHAIQRHNSAAKSEIGNRKSEIRYRLVHTGQHYDAKMSDVFFRELGIPQPDVNLEVGSGSHAVQTANLMLRFEPALLNAFREVSGPPSVVPDPISGCQHVSVSAFEKSVVPDSPPSSDSASPFPLSAFRVSAFDKSSPLPDWLIVVGDVNSTMACTLVAAKLGVKVAHVEAGLRSRDRSMPEEINRLVTDALADLLLTPSEDANENLRREGVPEEKIKLVGNIMIDALVANLPQARQSRILEAAGVTTGRYAYVTLHRPANVDSRDSLGAIMRELTHLSQRLPVVFPMHPRTRKMLAEYGIALNLGGPLKIIEPVGYHDSLFLTENARLVLTDSGGLQEESTYFHTPCLTLRPNTERPITVQVGSNRLTDASRLAQDLKEVLAREPRLGQIPPLWDGRAADRIVETLVQFA
jgi:UDP-N-acetylglucosamine 2-epimerase (non-hydrolysing)